MFSFGYGQSSLSCTFNERRTVPAQNKLTTEDIMAKGTRAQPRQSSAIHLIQEDAAPTILNPDVAPGRAPALQVVPRDVRNGHASFEKSEPNEHVRRTHNIEHDESGNGSEGTLRIARRLRAGLVHRRKSQSRSGSPGADHAMKPSKAIVFMDLIEGAATAPCCRRE